MEALTEVFELGGLLTAVTARHDVDDAIDAKAMQRSVSLAKEHFIPAMLSKNRRLRSLENLEKVN